MDAFVIEGGRKLYGEVKIDCAKNALLPLISAAAAIGGKCFFEDFPKFTDTEILLSIIKEMGGDFQKRDGGVEIDSSCMNTGVFPEKLFKTVRASVFMLGGILARFGYARCPLPGGCRIGERPINIHLDALRQMGAEITEEDGFVSCRAEKLIGAKIVLPFPSVGVTENIMIAGCFAHGDTVIENAAIEPEVMDLKKFLNACGGRVISKGRTFFVEGNKRLKGISYCPIPDRIEAGTFLYAAALVGGEVVLNAFPEKNICSFVRKSGNNACKIYAFNGNIYINAKGTPFSAAQIKAMPYPAYPTDMQSQTIALLSVSNGESVIEDGVFPSRFASAEQMKKLGADIRIDGGRAIINGVKGLRGSDVVAEDLRGGAGLVLACLKAEGRSVVKNAELLDRGYECFEDKLSLLGADVKRIELREDK